MSASSDRARLTATSQARTILAAGGHVITPRLRHIFVGSPQLPETWTGHCERCGESFSMSLTKGAWEAGGMVFVWAAQCRGEWRSYYHEEEEGDFDDD